jgi:predicted dehydrogenase
MKKVKWGVLGAARIAVTRVIPSMQLGECCEIVGIASRDREKAGKAARELGIPKVYGSYEEMLADPEIEAVYNPLPNHLHVPWSVRAAEAGKHVLCEKPFTANADEAAEVAAAARASGLVVMEAFHYRYHPLAQRMLDVVAGELGRLRYLEASVCFPLPRFSDIRYSYDLAGGATMDAGCYAINCLRLLGPGEPEVVKAKAKRHGPDVDRAMTASFRFPGGAGGRMNASLWSSQVLRIGVEAVGDRGVMRVLNFLAPHGYTRREHIRGEATYTYQLRAFAAAVLRGQPVITTPEDAVATMTVIDDVYRAAGLPLRGQPG